MITHPLGHSNSASLAGLTPTRPRAQQPTLDNRREIDGLRAVAVVPVIMFHAGVGGVAGGFVGVDVFFVISGYLISRIILNDLEQGRFSIAHFYERRARRILPALFFMMAVCLPLAWAWLLPRDMKQFSQSVAAVSFFSSNILFWQQSGYFDIASELKPLLHTWSLAVEEQFYIFYPIAIMLLWRRKQLIVPCLIVVSLASLALAQWGSAHKPIATFFLLPTRAWELTVGALTAFHLAHRPDAALASRWSHLFAALGLVMIVASIFVFDSATPFPSLLALMPTLGTALIIKFASPANLTGQFLGARPLVGIGLVSYSAYLWHQPLFAFARLQRFGDPPSSIVAALIALTFVMAVLSWRFVEQPFRRKNVIGRRSVFTAALAASIAFATFGFAGYLTDGFAAQRTNGRQREMLASATTSPMRADCHTDGRDYRRPSDACTYLVPGPTWAVFGDSHAVELAYALAQQLKERNQSVRHFSFSSCAPSLTPPGCQEWLDETVNFIAGSRQIQYVVVSFRINAALTGPHERLYPRIPDRNSPEAREHVWQGVVALLERLTTSGKKVVFVLQAPELPMPIQAIIMRRNDDSSMLRGVSRAWWSERSSFVYARLASLPPEVVVVDPAATLCGTADCYAGRDRQAYYFDEHHMSMRGAALIASDLLRHIR